MADPSYIDSTTGVLTDSEAWGAVASSELGSSQTSVAFTDPSDGSSLDWSQFMDMVLICYLRTDYASTSDHGKIFAGPRGGSTDTGSANYEMQRLYGYAGGASANSSTSSGHGLGEMSCAGANSPANVFGVAIVEFADINSGKWKTTYVQSAIDGWDTGSATSSGWVHIQANVWKNQSPIGKIEIWPGNGTNLVQYSRFDLFGVLPRMVA